MELVWESLTVERADFASAVLVAGAVLEAQELAAWITEVEKAHLSSAVVTLRDLDHVDLKKSLARLKRQETLS